MCTLQSDGWNKVSKDKDAYSKLKEFKEWFVALFRKCGST